MAETRLRTSPASRGVTLIELLVAAALALVMMGAVASLFGVLGRSFKSSQATMNQSSLLRSAAWQLRQDLTGVTCPLTPWLAPEINAGYFEIIEGPDNDSTHALDSQGQPTTNLEADTDDILMFTTQSLGGDFVGRFDGKTIESPYAEIAWFCRPSETQPVAGTTLYDLHRRQHLIVAYPDLPQLLDDLLNRAATSRTLPEVIDLLKSANPGGSEWVGFFDVERLWTLVNLTIDDIGTLNAGRLPQLTGTAALKATVTDFASRLKNLGLTTLLDRVRDNALPLMLNQAVCDISVRRAVLTTVAAAATVTTGTYLIPSSLGDLTKRENRFMRGGYSFVLESGSTRRVAARLFPFSFPVVTDPTSQDVWCAIPEAALDGTRRSTEDHVLTNVIGFDVRVFDPSAVVSATDARIPGDPGYAAPAVPQPGDRMGTYVDLGWGGGAPLLRTDGFPPAGKTAFQPPGVAVTAQPLSVKLPLPTYDTWPRHYEFNGIDDDADGIVDEGVNGVAGPDAFPQDVLDAETSPPYPVPLRGLEVRIRCYEPTSRQVRQVTVRHHFPE